MAKIDKRVILDSPDILKGKKFNKATILLSEYWDAKSLDTYRGETIEGSLQSGIEISYAPEYSSVSEIIPFPAITTVEKGIQAQTGGQIFGGILGQKQFTGASHINITIALKCLDEDGDGKVLRYAKALARQCQPIAIGAAEVAAAAKKGLSAAGDVLIESTKAAGAAVTFDGEGVADGAGKVMKIIEDNLKAQRVVTLKISDYLEFNDLVITSVSQSFSYEQSVAGPLYADFSIGFSTLRVPDSAKILTYYKDPKDPNNPRVTIT